MLLVVLLALVLSLSWTVAPLQEASGSLAKYGKLLLILAMMALIRDRREALCALAAFAARAAAGGAQFVDAFRRHAGGVGQFPHHRLALHGFSGYLDQGIMSAVFAALCWHLRHLVPGRFGPRIAIAVAVLSLANVFFVMVGRSGQLVGVALLSLAIMWQLPKKYRIIVAVLPFFLVAVLFASSPTMRERLTLVKTEVQGYSARHDASTSSGVRLAFGGAPAR